ncbi:MAG: hypothetical protein RBT46_02645 [Weeksellaceae bacterium]|jgi:uncharacterized membrane protein YkvA (DUF1232 family)|nr:hypothetical protein [Weeksellaceae bacterium]MDX9704588.1 hypothetical protein [Weeksellaceae bacterium]
MKFFKFYKIAGFVQKANSKDLSFFEFIRTIFLLFIDWIKGKYQPKKRNLLIGTLVILYVISPLDILPGLFFDDAMILFFAFKYFKKEAIRYLEWQKSLVPNNPEIYS